MKGYYFEHSSFRNKNLFLASFFDDYLLELYVVNAIFGSLLWNVSKVGLTQWARNEIHQQMPEDQLMVLKVSINCEEVLQFQEITAETLHWGV